MIIIPARLKSTRFNKKVLTEIDGLPMVIKTAKQVEKLDKIIIATDSQEVIEIANKYQFKAVMTNINHNSGTNRINEVCNNLGIDNNEIIINVQADEPFIEPEVVKAVIDRVKLLQEKEENIMMVSCYKIIDSDSADDPNHVKVIIDSNQNAIYFSRGKIPYNREHQYLDYFGHLGIYGFTRNSLKEFCNLPDSPLEHIEKLEQLRAISHNKKIAMVKVDSQSFGIDTEADLKRALKLFT
jgi:3-deoxy-manno-octulosonate cytidylyltransferase (CMP-KDO synthetase)